jgi:hypothetical protein
LLFSEIKKTRLLNNPASKTVLIITYYWPPAGGPGVQRWLKFVKYFREFGIEPVVYVPENPEYPLTDKDLVNDVPSDITILKHPISEPYKLARLFSIKKTKQISSGIITSKKQSPLEKLMLFIRGNFFIPDARVKWVKPSVTFLSEFLKQSPIDTIITTGPPHSLHLIGLQLKENLNLRWIADFRDPWTTIHYHKSLRLTQRSERKHKELEARVLNTADTIVVTSPTTKTEFEIITETPIEVVTNGFEPLEEKEVVLDPLFSISHIGSLLSERNPKVLWKVLSELCKENKSFGERLQIKLAGAVSEDVLASISAFGLVENCVNLGYVSHTVARELQRSAQILLIVEKNSPETRAIIPGKLFEYLSAKRPIIALGPAASDMEGIIEETRSGAFFNYSEEEALKEKLTHYFTEYTNGTLEITSEGIKKYSRKELTGRMAAIIKS